MSDDLIKRDDALNACVLREDNPPTEMQLSLRNVISALPAVPTHRYAGESEASVYNRKGFPPIGLQGHAHAPVADSHPAIDPAAIREAAWIEALDAAHEYTSAKYGMGFLKHPVDRERIIALIGETK